MFLNWDTNRTFGGTGTALVLNATTTITKSLQGNGSLNGLRRGCRFSATLFLNITTAIGASGGAVIFNFNGTEYEVPIPAGLDIGTYEYEFKGLCISGTVVWITAIGSKGGPGTYVIGTPSTFDFKVRLPAGTGAGSAVFVATGAA